MNGNGNPYLAGKGERTAGVVRALVLAGVILLAGMGPSANAATAGRTALSDGLYATAGARFRAALEADEPSAETRADLVDLLLQSYQGGGSWDLIEAALQSGSPYLVTLEQDGGVAYWTAMVHFHKGDDDAVLRLLEPLLEPPGTGRYGYRALRLAGWAHERAGRHDEAAALFQSVDRLAGGSPAGRADNLLDLGRVLRLAGHAEAATNVFARLAVDAPDSIRRARGRFELGASLRAGKRFVAAAEALTPLFRDDSLPADFRALAGMELAYAQFHTDGPTAAIETLESCRLLAGRSATQSAAGVMLGDFYIRAGRAAEGVPLLQAFVAESPQDARAPGIQLRIGQVLLDRGDWSAAAPVFQHYLEAFESRGEGLAAAYEGRGLALQGMERFTEASDVFLKAYEVAGDPPVRERTLLRAAEARFAAGRFQMAQELFTRFIDTYPEHPDLAHVRIQIAECMAARDALEDAVAVLGAVAGNGAGQDGRAAHALLRRAALQGRLRQWDASLASYEALLAQTDDDAVAAAGLFGRGLARYHLWQPEMIGDFEACRTRFPDSPFAEQATYMRAVSLYRLGRDAEALAAGRAFLDVYAGSDYAPLVHFWMAEVHYNLAAYAEAEQGFLGYAATYPRHGQVGEALFRAGLSAFRQHEFLRANAHFGQLFSTVPEGARVPDARFAQADALIQLGRFAEAILILDEVINRYPDHAMVPFAWLRKGDCQFSLGSEDATRFEESIRSYRVVTLAHGLRPGIQLQAEYKIGRSLQKLQREQDALEQYYARVMVPFFDSLSRDEAVSESGALWFTRAALNVAELLEKRQDWRQLARVLDRVGQTGVTIAAEARRRSRAIRTDYWWLFY